MFSAGKLNLSKPHSCLYSVYSLNPNTIFSTCLINLYKKND